jgi:hypothetical protein
MSEEKVSQEGSTFNQVGRDQYNYYYGPGCQRNDEKANCRRHNFTPSVMPLITSHFLVLLELNNYLQKMYRGSPVLAWETTYTGPLHDGQWLAIASSKHNKI